MRRRPAKRTILVLALCICSLGAVYRLALVTSLPVGYDEVFVMALGLDDMKSSLMEALFFLPIRRSNGITPLWWWVQYPSELIGPHLSLFALRLMPALLGLACLPFVWFVFGRRIGRGPTCLLLLFVATSDILVFCNSRGEFVESLTVPLTLAALALAGSERRAVLRGGLWAAILMAHLGKGLFVVAMLLAVELLVLWLSRPVPRRRLHGLLMSMAVGLLPTIGWLAVVDYFVFAAEPITTDYAPQDGVVSMADAVYKLTVAYSKTKVFMIAEPLDAAQPYLDLAVWPTTAISVVWLALGSGLSLVRFPRAAQPVGRRRRLSFAMAAVGLAFGAMLILRGACSGRIHLTYLPAVWLAVAMTFWRYRGRRDSWLAIVLVAVWAAYIGFAAGWTDWCARAMSASQAMVVAGVMIVALPALWAGLRKVAAVRPVTLPAVFLCVCAAGAAARGPFWWGNWARFEPYRSGDPNMPSLEMAALDDYRSGRTGPPEPEAGTLDLYLAHFYITEENLVRAEYFARLAVEKDPDNAAAWLYLGEVYRRQGEPTTVIENAWRRALALKPDSETLRERLDALPAGPGSAPATSPAPLPAPAHRNARPP